MYVGEDLLLLNHYVQIDALQFLLLPYKLILKIYFVMMETLRMGMDVQKYVRLKILINACLSKITQINVFTQFVEIKNLKLLKNVTMETYNQEMDVQDIVYESQGFIVQMLVSLV